jgi:hypothetical protein
MRKPSSRALEWLNTNKDEPGFRFAYEVSAHLEIVSDADEARARMESDDTVAMVLMHDLDDDERNALVRHCDSQRIGVCYTVDAPRRPGPRKEPWRVVFRTKSTEEPPAPAVWRDADGAGRGGG